MIDNGKNVARIEKIGLKVVEARKPRKRKPVTALVRAERAHKAELARLRTELEATPKAVEMERVLAELDGVRALPGKLQALEDLPSKLQALEAVTARLHAERSEPAFEPAAKRTTLPAIGGALLGGFIPLAAHTLVNAPEFGSAAHLLWIVVACLAYSAPTVCGWASEFTLAGATHWTARSLGWLKALGFVGCLEGILVAAPASCAWLSWVALAMLMGVNSTILAIKFGNRQARGVA